MPDSIETSERTWNQAKNAAVAQTGGDHEAAPNRSSRDFSTGMGASGEQEPKERQHEPKDKRQAWETASTLEEYWNTRRTFFTEEERTEAWSNTANIVKTYSDEIIDRWNREIDTLLVYAGLFSAILTAFNVQSYQLLTPTPTTDPVILALERISAQLGGFTVNIRSVNSTAPVFVNHYPSHPTPPQWVVWLNAFWFSSLIFSLSSASIGIMVKQWLNEYNTGLFGTSRQIMRLRQLRLNSMERWRVKDIVRVLPVLLQIGSASFFAGLLILLWQLNQAVAIVGTVLTGTLALFSLFTIITPTIVPHCFYLSPASWGLFELTRLMKRLIHSLRCRVAHWIFTRFELSTRRTRDSHPYLYRIWTNLRIASNDVSILTWRGVELFLLSQRSAQLDGDLVVTAYTTQMDPRFLQHAAVCITELFPNVARKCFQAIRSSNIAHWGKDNYVVPMMFSAHDCMWTGSVLALSMVSDIDVDAARSPSSSITAALRTAYSYISHVHHDISADDVRRSRLSCVDFAYIIRHYERMRQLYTSLPYRRPEDLPYDFLVEKLEHAATSNLGHKVRQHVISCCLQVLQEGLNPNRISINNPATRQALAATECVIRSVPPPGGVDCDPCNPGYQTVQGQAIRALDVFLEFLSTSQALSGVFAADVAHIFDILSGWYSLNHDAEVTALITPRLIENMASYVDIALGRGKDKWDWKRRSDWIRRHKGKEVEESGQNPSAVMVARS